MEEHFVWVTTRQVGPGTLTDFREGLAAGAHTEGMLRAYAYWPEDQTEEEAGSRHGRHFRRTAWESSGTMPTCGFMPTRAR